MPQGVASNNKNAAGEIPENATAILFDMLNSANEGVNPGISIGNATNNLKAINDQNDAIRQLVNYLRTIRPEDRVALFVLGYRLHPVQDFTGDPEVLRRAAERLRGLDQAGIEVTTQAQLAALLEPPPIQNSDGSVTYIGTAGFANSIAGISSINRATTTADAFEEIARHMSGLPGRKNLVWMSAGFPFRPPTPPRKPGDARDTREIIETPDDFSAQLSRASKALNDAGVSIYPVDYQGLGGEYPEVMMRLASATGGNVTYRTNDLKEAVATAVSDGDVSYVLGFYPTDEKYDNRLHELKVRVDRRDVDLHYRDGYYATARTLSEKQRKDLLAETLGSDANSSQIGLTARGEPDPSMPGSYNIMISVDATNLDVPVKGDRRVGQLVLAMRVESSKLKNGVLGNVSLNFTEEQFQNTLKRGFVMRQTVQAGKRDRLRIVVQDQSTGLTGALWLSLEGR